MKVKDIRVAKKNPRTMGKEARKALAKSLSEFNDISGITINQQTGNVVSGNHRWEELIKVHGQANLKLNPLKGEYYTLDAKKGFTGFIVRIVNWPESKELAANVTANSNLVQGEFTSDLQSILDEIEGDIESQIFEDLRLDELQIDLDDIDDLDWDEDEVKASKKANDRLPEAKSEEVSEVKHITSSVKIIIPADLKDRVKKDISEALAKKDYYDEIEIV